jgi:hypothetical protein
MKQIKGTGLTKFLKKKENWLKKRVECARKKGIKYCDMCKQWPCEFLKRPVLVPVDLDEFKNFMKRNE